MVAAQKCLYFLSHCPPDLGMGAIAELIWTTNDLACRAIDWRFVDATVSVAPASSMDTARLYPLFDELCQAFASVLFQ
jgi:hypothetical protein